MKLVVVVPTYMRPETLTKLMRSLERELGGEDLYVIVGDNACQPSIAELLARFALKIHYVAVRERGLASVRNALVRAATELVPDWDYVVMLDDDGTVEPGWFSQLKASIEKHQPDIIGGPVVDVVSQSGGVLARNSIYATRPRLRSGQVDDLTSTHNIAVSRKVVEGMGGALFNTSFNFSGGEDYEFLRTAKRKGFMFYWCDEAVVSEPTPAIRLKPFKLLHRYYSTGVYMAHVDLAFDGTASAWRAALRGIFGMPVAALLALIKFDLNLFVRRLFGLAHYAGRIAGLLGGKTDRYRAPES